jgi:REP element-mobilizing transposase RayT
MLHTETFYHIYNHANGIENLFIEDKNYPFFIQKYILHIEPIASTYAYCLMPNHFHFLIKIKEEKIIRNIPKFKDIDTSLIPYQISKSFANLFSSYTQAYNKVYKRRGSLFLKNFKYKEINNEKYLFNLLFYIHKNPIHHGFVMNLEDWQYSSYHSYLHSSNNNFIETEYFLNEFSSVENFIKFHQQNILLDDRISLEK